MAEMKLCPSKVRIFHKLLIIGTTFRFGSSESGNMIIMALSYAQKTGDLGHIQRYVRSGLAVDL